ncbi:MAG: protein kinase [Pseudomonadota bacterium]|nr:protein kinase [Pseudomonadota bacterium]
MQRAGSVITLGTQQYVLRERIAASSYGVLWRADAEHGPVALKLVNAEQMTRADVDQRPAWTASARREIDFLKALAPWDARHIVRLLASGDVDGLPAMALELLDGDLARHDVSTLDRQLALAWIGQLNQALAKVHSHGWRYLDLKPANILLDRRANVIKLADFGTNRDLHDNAAHAYAGTASWQAPEQFFPDPQQRFHSDARSDYFALGALLFYLVCGGRQLRYGAACGAAWREHGSAGAIKLRAAHQGAVPRVLQDDEVALFVARGGARALPLLTSLLAIAPDRRPRHALDISRALQQAA